MIAITEGSQETLVVFPGRYRSSQVVLYISLPLAGQAFPHLQALFVISVTRDQRVSWNTTCFEQSNTLLRV